MKKILAITMLLCILLSSCGVKDSNNKSSLSPKEEISLLLASENDVLKENGEGEDSSLATTSYKIEVPKKNALELEPRARELLEKVLEYNAKRVSIYDIKYSNYTMYIDSIFSVTDSAEEPFAEFKTKKEIEEVKNSLMIDKWVRKKSNAMGEGRAYIYFDKSYAVRIEYKIHGEYYMSIATEKERYCFSVPEAAYYAVAKYIKQVY